MARPFDEDPDRIDPDLQAQIRNGRTFSAWRSRRCCCCASTCMPALRASSSEYDLLLTPTTPVVSWPLDQLGPALIGGQPAGPRGHAGYTPLVNYCQAPACSVPAGLVDGLPIGLQIVGPRYADARVLQMAAQVERLLGRRPTPRTGPDEALKRCTCC
jgi:aspartyl-tRNA(Asn)/glutamyl-tRNA(Gln) amidotransferase subunit A